MPEICRFYGIIIRMYYADHPPPHFHAEYGEYEALIRIEDTGIFSGSLPPRALEYDQRMGFASSRRIESNLGVGAPSSAIRKNRTFILISVKNNFNIEMYVHRTNQSYD